MCTCGQTLGTFRLSGLSFFLRFNLFSFCLLCFSLGSFGSLLSNLGSFCNSTLGFYRLHYEFDNGHRCVIALTVTDLGDASVATGTLGHCRCDYSKKLVYYGLVGNGSQHATASRQIALLTEGDETFSHRAHTLCLSQGGGDALVLEELRRQVIEH